jgi:hypothetical protein
LLLLDMLTFEAARSIELPGRTAPVAKKSRPIFQFGYKTAPPILNHLATRRQRRQQVFIHRTIEFLLINVIQIDKPN